jgi:hypothetical protein
MKIPTAIAPKRLVALQRCETKQAGLTICLSEPSGEILDDMLNLICS